jgi:hypothetical protein
VTSHQKRVVPAENHSLRSVQVCSPQSHLNMRTVLPLSGLSMVMTLEGLCPHLPQEGVGFGW